MAAQLALLLGFMTAVGVIAYLELRWLASLWLDRGKDPKPGFWPWAGPRTARALTWGLNTAAVVGLVCMLYGWLYEPTALELTTIPLVSDKVRPRSGVIRIVHVSDLHSEAEPLNEPRAAALIRGLEPDLILLTGDYVNTTDGLATARGFLQALPGGVPVFLVTGNYDIGRLPDDAFKGLPARELDLETAELMVRGTPVRVTGFSVSSEPFFQRYSKRLAPRPAYDIMLSHYTDLADQAAAAGFDLYLAGHTHGGQVRLPFYGALVTLAKSGKRFEAGRYLVGKMALYVNRGLGLEGGRAPRVRFLCRPEVAVLELRAGAEGRGKIVDSHPGMPQPQPIDIRVGKDESYLSQARAAGFAMPDFQKEFPASDIGAGWAPVKSAAGFQVRGRSLFWLAPDQKQAVVDRRYFTDLKAGNATTISPGERQVLGRWLGGNALPPSDLALFLIKAQIIQTYWHIEAQLQRVAEQDTPRSYRAEFSGTHVYFTNERNEDAFAFAVELDKKSGELSVVGRALDP